MSEQQLPKKTRCVPKASGWGIFASGMGWIMAAGYVFTVGVFAWIGWTAWWPIGLGLTVGGVFGGGVLIRLAMNSHGGVRRYEGLCPYCRRAIWAVGDAIDCPFCTGRIALEPPYFVPISRA